MATIGYITTHGELVCLPCVDYCGERNIGSVDYPDGSNNPIEDPAPHGLFDHNARNRDRYGAPCALCGWSIRRKVR